MALSFEETVNIIGEVASNLAHPQSIRPPCNPADLNTSRRQLDKEQDDEPLQSARRPNFYCEEITGDDLLPMSAQEFLPGRLSDSFGGWVDAVPFQDVCDRIVRQKMPQIGQRALEAAVTPGSILLSHLHNQSGHFPPGFQPSHGSKRAPIVFLSNQFSMPSQQSLGSDDGRHPRQKPSTKFLRLRRQSTALVIGKCHAPITVLFSKNPIFLDEIFDHMLLMLVHPATDRDDKKRKRVQGHAHRRILPLASNALTTIGSMRSSF